MPHLEQITELEFIILPLEEQVQVLRDELARRIAIIPNFGAGLTGRALIRANEERQGQIRNLNLGFRREADPLLNQIAAIKEEISQLQTEEHIVVLPPIEIVPALQPILEQNKGIDLKQLAIIGGVILLLI